MKDIEKLHKKAHKAIGSPYSGGLVAWEDIKHTENIPDNAPTLYHERHEGQYKLIVAFVKV